MADGIVGETAEVAQWRLLRRFALLAHFPAVVDPADEIREGPSGMRQADVELGKSIEQPAKDQVGGGDCGIKRISQKVMQIVTRQPLGPDDIERMEKDRDSQRVNP